MPKLVLHLFTARQERRFAWAILLFALIPYAGLMLYLVEGHLSGKTPVQTPDGAFLAALFVLGGLVPGAGLALVLRKLIRERERFELRMLVEVYGFLIFIYATGYSILQSSSATPAIEGMIPLWAPNEPAGLGEHMRRLHLLFLDALYLSVSTITTVGYGDLAPISGWARLLSALEGLTGVAFLGIALGHYFSVCIRREERDKATTEVRAASEPRRAPWRRR